MQPFFIELSWFLLLFVSLTSGLQYSSHTETYTQTVYYPDVSCYNYKCAYTCEGRGCYRRCSYKSTCRACCVVTRSRTETRTRCQPYWTGPNCNIPWCSTPCQNGQTCIEGNRCQCLTAGETKCKAEGCPNPKRSCYPGTCSGSSCDCPPEFNGTNCETLLQTPEIYRCQVKLFHANPKEVEVASANCSVEGHEPEITWVGKDSFSRVEASWDTKYQYPVNPVLPGETRHIKDARFGVTETKANVRVNIPNSPVIHRDITPVCLAPESTPQAHVDCQRRSMQWSEFGVSTLPVNSTIEVIVSSRLGGYKTLHEGDQKEAIRGIQTSERRVLFRADMRRPFHCRQVKNCSDPAISVTLDAVQNAAVDFEFSNWFDYESGIKSYEVEFYELLKSLSTTLVRAEKPKDKRSLKEDVNKLSYTFPAPGVYSVELTVYDYANNPSKARKIMIYCKENYMQKTNHPFVVDQASPESGYRWITKKLRDDGDGLSRLTLSWKGRYTNLKYLNDGWLNRVEPWTDTSEIDDDSGSGGNRTINAPPNANGTAFFRIAFVVDKQGGFDLSNTNFPFDLSLSDNASPPQSTWVGITPDVSTKELVMPTLTPNDTVVIWMQAYDITAHYVEDKIMIRFDDSEPEIDIQKPAELRPNYPDPYKSSILIKARDLQSGIANVSYFIYDATLRVNITTGNSAVTMLKPSGGGLGPGGQRSLAVCRPESGDCYCINGGECFQNVIWVTIDHCDIDQYYADDKSIQFHYVVINQAGNTVRPTQYLSIKFEGGTPRCRPVVAFTLGTILAIVIGLMILIILVVLVLLMILRWKQDKHPIPNKVRSFATSMRQRITNTEKVHDCEGRVIYRSKTRRGKLTEDDDDIYVDGSDPGGWRVNRDQVEMAETVAQGKFAIVKKAYLKKGGETKIVAAKFLPTGASDRDRALLKAKIAFHGNRVPPHDNIVRLMGVLDDGPVMLLEFCDLTLKDWLSKIEKVDSDVLENLLNFSLHIASGMEHLHSKSIIHRRLAVRNILLKKDGLNGLVAKLIGFGSFEETESDEGAAESASNVVPLKWLAPETLETVSKGKPLYTEKSDVWSYGVTIWEIYSLGATPYPGKKSVEVEAILKSGYRMPRPNDCPHELFDTVAIPCWNAIPKKRPDFRTICKQIRHFRSGGVHQEGYYAVDPHTKDYSDPKERTSDYISANKKAKDDCHVEELYDDTTK